MGRLPGHMPLAAVSMPGTHNSASFAIRAGHLAAVVEATRCQWWNLRQQLVMGIRFLDLRVRPDGVLCHGRVGCALTLQEALEECSTFLRQHPEEVVITRIKDEGASKATAKGVNKLVNSLVESAAYPFYLQMRLPALSEVRGRIVLLCDWAGGLLGMRWGGDKMSLQDEYWHRTGTNKWRVVQMHIGREPPVADRLQVHFTSATALPRKVPITLARSVNPKLAAHLRVYPCGRRFWGIIAMDFPSASLCDLIIRSNWPTLDPCRSVNSLVVNGPCVRSCLDDLGCELKAAATRADAAELHQPEELPRMVRALAHIFVALTLERVQAELSEPCASESESSQLCRESACKDGWSQQDAGLSPSDTRGPDASRSAPVEKLAKPGRGLLHRFTRGFARCGRRSSESPSRDIEADPRGMAGGSASSEYPYDEDEDIAQELLSPYSARSFSSPSPSKRSSTPNSSSAARESGKERIFSEMERSWSEPVLLRPPQATRRASDAPVPRVRQAPPALAASIRPPRA